MEIAEIIELVLIPVIAAAAWFAAAELPQSIGLGKLLLWASALLLLQSLLRDFWLLAKARRTQSMNPPRVAQCMCVESMIGMTGVLAGLLLFSLGVGKTISMPRWGWFVFVIVVLGVGFGIKDFVLESRPWRLRRDKDHVNIVVRWRK